MEASDGSEERAPARPLSHMQAGRRGESQQDALDARHEALHARATGGKGAVRERRSRRSMPEDALRAG